MLARRFSGPRCAGRFAAVIGFRLDPTGARMLDRSRLRWWRSAAAAGIVAVAFALGWLSHVSRLREVNGPGLRVAASPSVAPDSHSSSSEATMPASALPPGPIDSDRQFAIDLASPNRGELVQTVAQVRIGPEGAGATVPILAGPGIDGDWLKAQPPPVSEHEQVVLQRLGYQVDQRRRVLIAPLPDGRRSEFPHRSGPDSLHRH